MRGAEVRRRPRRPRPARDDATGPFVTHAADSAVQRARLSGARPPHYAGSAMTARPARAAPIAAIPFHRTKYGPDLLCDACAVEDLPGFIADPRPHALRFTEVALVTAGAGTLEIDGEALPVAPGRVLLTRPGEVRRWRLHPVGDAEATASAPLAARLLFFEHGFVDGFFGEADFLATLPLAGLPPRHRSIALEPGRFARLVDLVDDMRDELRRVQPDSHHALRAQTYRLLVDLARERGGTLVRERERERDLERDRDRAGAPARADARDLVRRFTALVDAQFAHTERVACYADALGVTPRHLNRVVHARLGRTASDVIHQRLLREATRLLRHTALPVATVADTLGFSDASYFVRFFRRHAGLTPGAYRARGA